QQPEHGLPVGGRTYAIPVASQVAAQKATKPRVVVDNKYMSVIGHAFECPPKPEKPDCEYLLR
ncbi:MAG: hypothetical protein ACE5F8_02780, partial [Woeseiaceae bacterium]